MTGEHAAVHRDFRAAHIRRIVAGQKQRNLRHFVRLRDALQAPFDIDGTQVPLRASIGGATVPMEADSLEALLALADQRMYAQKRQRKAEAARVS